MISLPLLNSLEQTVRVDYFGPLLLTPRGNTYSLLIADRFSRRADMYVVTAAKFSAEETTNIINKYITQRGCPVLFETLTRDVPTPQYPETRYTFLPRE